MEVLLPRACWILDRHILSVEVAHPRAGSYVPVMQLRLYAASPSRLRGPYKKEENENTPVLLCHMPERLPPDGRVCGFPRPAVLPGIAPSAACRSRLRTGTATFQSAVPARSFCLRVSAPARRATACPFGDRPCGHTRRGSLSRCSSSRTPARYHRVPPASSRANGFGARLQSPPITPMFVFSSRSGGMERKFMGST